MYLSEKFCAMKKNITVYTGSDYTHTPKRHGHYVAFSKKDNIIRNLEVIVACIIAFVAGLGVYGILN